MNLSEGLQEAGEEKKMLENEKYWNNPPIYEYNIMCCTISCGTLGEHGDREWVRIVEVNLIKTWCMPVWSARQNPLELSLYT
jgi:hypothetical protein